MRGVVGEYRFKFLGQWPGFGEQVRAQGAISAEDALLHAEGFHLLENVRGRNLVGPQHDGIGTRTLDDFELARVIRIAGHELLFNDDGMAEAPGCITEFDDAEASVAAIHAEDSHALEAELGEDAACQGQTLHPVVLQVSEVPRNVSLGNGGVSGSRVDDGNLSLQCDAQRNVR